MDDDDDPVFRLEAALAEGRIVDAQRDVVGVALNGLDLLSAVDACIRSSGHPDEGVRGNSILGFGHLARRFGSLPFPVSHGLIERALDDPSEYVRGHAESAADDTAQFLGWAFPALEQRRAEEWSARVLLLRRLVACVVPVSGVADQIRELPWNSDGPLVTVEPRDVIAVLRRHLAHELGASDVAEWADNLHVRDDLEMSEGLQALVYELANREMNCEVTRARALEIVSALERYAAADPR